MRIELRDAAERICEVLPPKVVWDLFSSRPNEEGGSIIFPYCRIETVIYGGKLSLESLKKSKEELQEAKRIEEYYSQVSILAMKALVWVEVGFKGFENLARCGTAIRSSFGLEEGREKRALGEGQRMYKEFLSGFVEMRESLGITEDCFTQYGLEGLLNTGNQQAV